MFQKESNGHAESRITRCRPDGDVLVDAPLGVPRSRDGKHGLPGPRGGAVYDVGLPVVVGAGLLVPHEELEAAAWEPGLAYKVLRPEPIEFISYPYEWSFSQYRDAALVALEVQRRALRRGMILKDCSAYNVQFHKGRPIF